MPILLLAWNINTWAIEKKRNTHLQCVNACSDGGYAHIASMSISSAFAYI